jgi:hypothetical protein
MKIIAHQRRRTLGERGSDRLTESAYEKEFAWLWILTMWRIIRKEEHDSKRRDSINPPFPSYRYFEISVAY